jgi:hypothetical protein
MSFVLVEDNYDRIIPLLMAKGLGFSTSPEYQDLIGTAADLAGVLSSAFTAYIGRRNKEGVDDTTMQRLAEPLNELAAWNDYRVRDLLRDEVFERLENDGQLMIVSKFGSEALRALLHEWQTVGDTDCQR